MVVAKQHDALVAANNLEYLVPGRDHLRMIAFTSQKGTYLSDMQLLHVALIVGTMPIMIDGVKFLSQLIPPNVEPGIVCSRHGPDPSALAERKGPVSTDEDFLLRIRCSLTGERRNGCDSEE